MVLRAMVEAVLGEHKEWVKLTPREEAIIDVIEQFVDRRVETLLMKIERLTARGEGGSS